MRLLRWRLAARFPASPLGAIRQLSNHPINQCMSSPIQEEGDAGGREGGGKLGREGWRKIGGGGGGTTNQTINEQNNCLMSLEVFTRLVFKLLLSSAVVLWAPAKTCAPNARQMFSWFLSVAALLCHPDASEESEFVFHQRFEIRFLNGCWKAFGYDRFCLTWEFSCFWLMWSELIGLG